ncbi:MAG: FadR family transcriptional regulator [Rhizobiales bacterium]|nr:FadR family transcriptional regulator [Hyphomicrobiales bacterium]
MSITYEPVVTTSVTRQISEKIRESILDGRLKAEDQLPTEHELADQFNVSRPTIREALKRLAAQNLIHSRRGPSGGTFVRAPKEKEVRASLITAATLLVSFGEFDLTDIAEARHELELMCGRLAAERRSEIHLAAMAAEIALQKSDDFSDEDFCASDVRFHRALVDATGNPVLQFVMSTVIEALQPVENMIIFRFRDREKIIRQHEKILKAIKAGNVAKTEKAITEQMSYLRKQFAKAQAHRQSTETPSA